MLIIRLKRTGRRNDPSFRIVVGEKIYSPKSGKHLEQLGSYNPKSKVSIVDEAKVKSYIAQGAQMSDTIHNLFLSKGIITGKKINVLPAFKAAPLNDTPSVSSGDQPKADVAEVEVVAEEPAPEAVPEPEPAA